MCLVMLGWNTNKDYPLIVAANRDERFDRPASSLGWWDDQPDILAGRDLQAGGTWFGVDRRGRFALVTNFRDLKAASALRSRGELVTQWLSGDMSASAFQHELERSESTYAGYNLLFGDLRGVHYFSNRSVQSGALDAKNYGLSNALLDTPWPKVVKARQHLDALQGHSDLEPEHFMGFLQDSKPAPDAQLPVEDLSLETRRLLSAPFILGEHYGTRCSTLLTVNRHGQARMHEQHYAPLGKPTERFDMAFEVVR